MDPFIRHTGLAAPLDRVNVDTDQIVPKEFLKRVERTGYGQFLFYDWRYKAGGEENEEFVLNRPRYRGASILLAGRNFGSGSSREHAVWALHDFGFRTVIASSFADIFHSNALGNGFLPVMLSEDDVALLMNRARDEEGYRITVDLEARTVEDECGFQVSFSIDEFSRYRLLNGLDDIGLTLRHSDAIERYERAGEASLV